MGVGISFFYLSHVSMRYLCLREGSRNYAELLSLKLLLIFVVEKGCGSIKIYGDSMNVINWKWGIQ